MIHDILILGAGPAGLAAGLYAGRGNMDTLIFERTTVGGQISLTNDVENYPGFPDGAGGQELADLFLKQAEKFGAKLVNQTVNEISKSDHTFRVSGPGGQWDSKALIFACGADPRRLEIPGEREFTGRGVSYCATCDAFFFRGKHVMVVGGGDAAVEESLFLTKFAETVTIVHRRDQLRASKILQDRAFNHEKISFRWDTVLTEICGESIVTHVKARNVKTEQVEEVPIDGVFVFVGHIPNTGLVKDLVELDEHGLIRVNEYMESSLPGLFACGDCRSGTVRQMVQAAGDGAAAAIAAIKYVDSL
ncbi:MAG TPA: thioredoxin-disulfide reductase [bacterium]|nr:thioredoxin-disulfide reductase [bacterium]HQO33242.1 thioredoxin-disulfide reductase [bacterium]HQP97618.1 thioredoxin-disulfide reductase [bacterium]